MRYYHVFTTKGDFLPRAVVELSIFDADQIYTSVAVLALDGELEGDAMPYFRRVQRTMEHYAAMAAFIQADNKGPYAVVCDRILSRNELNVVLRDWTETDRAVARAKYYEVASAVFATPIT